MEIDKEYIFQRHILKNRINLFLGAGFSFDAYNMDKKRLPLGEELKELMIEEFELEQYKSFSLSQLSNIIKSTHRGDFHRFLHRLYKVYDFDEAYNYLDEIKIKNIFTLNIDNLIELIFEQYGKKNILYDVSISGVIDNEGIDFYKLHGSVTYPNEHDLLFTSEELSIFFAKERSKFHVIALKIASNPTLFWGTKMEDANVLSLLSKETIKNIEPKEKWIVINPEKEGDIAAEYFRSMNFNVIRANTLELLSYFNDKSATYIEDKTEYGKNNQKIDRLLNLHFSSNYINKILTVNHPVRPIKSFFSGDDPVWSDIIENKIIKISAYNDCLAKIFKNDIVFITGGIGSGKSTLLMQLSVDSQVDGLKVYFNGLAKPKAVKINEMLYDQPGSKIIFIDNISNNIESFLYLRETGRYKIICADRDLNYDKVKHLISFRNEEIIDITELSAEDVQAVCDLAHNTTFSMTNRKMSLFEIAYYVWQGKKLTSKIEDLIFQLSSNEENKELLEFFALMTYVRCCNISASMDMLLLYYSDDEDDEVDYKTIYRYVNRLQSMIDDEEHFTIGNEQDFFTLRSHLFAELSMPNIPPKILAKVLKKFSNNVHKDCIVRYDIFKRKGYDADIAKLAFYDLEEGKEYYENIISMDKSEYRYQQYALYLFRKNSLKDAWDQIETAHSINPKNLAIKNTHAFILFQTNIYIQEDVDTVKETLDYTFDVIANCISKDMRKTFHVITFAENAVSYFRRFFDTSYRKESDKYIDDANTYICDELNKSEFISRNSRRKLEKLKKEIKTIMAEPK